MHIVVCDIIALPYSGIICTIICFALCVHNTLINVGVALLCCRVYTVSFPSMPALKVPYRIHFHDFELAVGFSKQSCRPIGVDGFLYRSNGQVSGSLGMCSSF